MENSQLETRSSLPETPVTSRPNHRGGNPFRSLVEDCEYLASRFERVALRTESAVDRERFRRYAEIQLHIAANLDGTNCK
jgi:hypothetical protein